MQFLLAAITGCGIVLHDLTFEDPDLDTDDAIRGFRVIRGIIDVGAQRVQRHPAFTIPFGPRNLGTAKAARDVDLIPSAPIRMAF